MAVIVSDFEIITDTSDDEDESSTDSQDTVRTAASLRPIDVECVVERDRRRRHRLRAH